MSDGGKRPSWVGLVIRIVLVLVVIAVVVAVGQAVDWSEVAEAARQLTPGMILALLLLVIVRQVCNAAPLAVFVPQIGYWRATQNDTAAAVVATVAPPPADLVLRFAMFRSWGVDLVPAAAGLSLNTLLFYIVRFAAPVFGLVTLIAANRYDDTAAAVALISGAAAVALAAAVIVVARSERGAAWIGRTAGRIVERIRPGSVTAAAWEARMLGFRERVAEMLRRGWWRASLFLVAMVMTEAVLVVAAMRFTGVPSDAVSLGVLIGAFCITYLMTALPFGGLGILDLTLYSILVAEAGQEYAPAIVAGLMIWRAATMLVPLIAGGAILLAFRGRRGALSAEPVADGDVD